jgi:2-phospho-L-lactate transferase/gluconeogenesis factor (CofD/UPF0052 family)
VTIQHSHDEQNDGNVNVAEQPHAPNTFEVIAPSEITEAPTATTVTPTTQPGETDGYTVSRHLDVIEAHVGGNLFDYVVVNSNNAPPLSVAALDAGIHRVPFDRERAAQRPLHYVLADVISPRITTHHDPEKLARVIMKRVWR